MSNNYLTGYKVVRMRGKTWKAGFKPATRRAKSLRYYLGKTTEVDPRDGGPMTLFSHLEHAVKFARGISDKTCIMEVQYIPTTDSAIWKKPHCEHIGVDLCDPNTHFTYNLRVVEVIL